MALNAEQRREWVQTNVAADLTYIWEQMGVTLDHQYELGQNYANVALFGALADTRADARTALGRDLGIDPAANPASRARLAAIVAAWQQAADAAEKERSVKAEARVMGLPKPLLQTERHAMRAAVERTAGRMEEKDEPSPDYVAVKLEEVEAGDLTASMLDEVCSVRDDSHGQLQSNLDSTGRIRITKEKKKAKMPVNSEELRSKLKLEGNMLLMLTARFRNKTWFQGLTATVFQKYLDYVLGEKIYQLQISKGDGSAQTIWSNPSWDLVLSFEHKLRKEVYRRASREGRALVATLEDVISDANLKETHFVTPLTLELSRRSQPSHPAGGATSASSNYDKWRTTATQRAGPKGGGGKSQGKGTRKGKLGANSRAGFVYSTTPDGRQICYAFNNAKCDGKSCNRVHVCQFCLDPGHNRHACTQRKEPTAAPKANNNNS